MRRQLLDQKVTFERRAEVSRNSLNEPKFLWSQVASVWASLQELQEGEVAREKAEGVVATIQLSVIDTPTIRSLTLADRMQVLGWTWNLVGLGQHAKSRGSYFVRGARCDTSGGAP